MIANATGDGERRVTHLQKKTPSHASTYRTQLYLGAHNYIQKVQENNKTQVVHYKVDTERDLPSCFWLVVCTREPKQNTSQRRFTNGRYRKGPTKKANWDGGSVENFTSYNPLLKQRPSLQKCASKTELCMSLTQHFEGKKHTEDSKAFALMQVRPHRVPLERSGYTTSFCFLLLPLSHSGTRVGSTCSVERQHDDGISSAGLLRSRDTLKN